MGEQSDPAHAVDPAHVDVRTLRRYAAAQSEGGIAPSTIARRLAALRGLFRTQMEIGAREDNPAELLSSPKKAQRLPHVLKAGEVAALLESIPATTPLELRDRALFELAYACGLRAEELVSLDLESIDFDSETVRVEGKGSKTRLVPVGEHALAALERYLARGRPALAADGGRSRRPRVVPFEVGAAALDLGREAAAERLGEARGGPLAGAGAGPSARAPALVCDPSARRRRRPAGDPGTPRPCDHIHHSGLHSR